MFREIKKSEKITDTFIREEEHDGYKEIKPETDITIEQAKNFIDELFAI